MSDIIQCMDVLIKISSLDRMVKSDGGGCVG